MKAKIFVARESLLITSIRDEQNLPVNITTNCGLYFYCPKLKSLLGRNVLIRTDTKILNRNRCRQWTDLGNDYVRITRCKNYTGSINISSARLWSWNWHEFAKRFTGWIILLTASSEFRSSSYLRRIPSCASLVRDKSVSAFPSDGSSANTCKAAVDLGKYYLRSVRNHSKRVIFQSSKIILF